MPAMKPAAPSKKFGTIILTPKKAEPKVMPRDKRKSC